MKLAQNSLVHLALWLLLFCVASHLKVSAEAIETTGTRGHGDSDRKLQASCFNPESCREDSDCCVGSFCRDVGDGAVESSKLLNEESLLEKECVTLDPLPPVTECPAPGSTIDIQDGHYRMKPYGDLCTLTMISVAQETGEITTVAPLARSYLGHNWEVAAGSYATANVFSSQIQCENGACSITLPPLADRQSRYRLSSYDHTLSEIEKRARFLEMTTFGTTPRDLSSGWEFANEAEWLKHQIDLPLSSHREYFRKRTNPRWTYSQTSARSDHPCDKNSRWRRFAFTRNDKYTIDGASSGYLYVQNTTFIYDDTGREVPSGPYILKIDSHARTVVEAMRWDRAVIRRTFPSWDPIYAYKICRPPQEWTGGRLMLQTKPHPGYPNGRCERISGQGNPILNFAGFEASMGPHVLGLPSDGSLSPIDQWQNGGTSGRVDQFILLNGLSDDLCNAISSQSEDFQQPVFGNHPTEGILQWDPRLVLQENTLETPLEDGGREAEIATNGKTRCSDVPRTFLNFDACFLSNATDACGVTAEKTTDTAIDLNNENLLALHLLTKRYVYAIQGLKVKQDEFDYSVSHPCTPGVRSRWERQTGRACDNPTQLGSQTRKALRKLFAVSFDDNPLVRDITFPRVTDVPCDDFDTDVEIELQLNNDCWKHVHPEHLSVWDVTYWTRNNTHPGNFEAANSGRPNPIKKWVEAGSSVLVYPAMHPTDVTLNHDMRRWDANFGKFAYVGRYGDSLSFRDLPSYLQNEAVAEHFGGGAGPAGSGIIICGSPGEVANEKGEGGTFDVAADDPARDTRYRKVLARQREVVWTMVALNGKDQLRQRMAWALSQIFAIAKTSIRAEQRVTEVFLQFYDILVRNAFGSYLDVLREISYSPIMAENLSFLNSRSSAYTFKKYFRHEFADENFAREIMQLFTTGLLLLNNDGTPKLGENNQTLQVYTNTEIRSFARAWTGFSGQNTRGNYEDLKYANRLDPMRIIPEWRDAFPKTDLYGGYLGDTYPLCVDLPQKQFLRKGAKYRLLGGSPIPELQYDPPRYTERFTLNQSVSSLFQELCNDQGGGCDFRNQIVIDKNLDCTGNECLVDTVRVVEVVFGVFYEYVQPPCVEHPFYQKATKLHNIGTQSASICGNPLLAVAQSVCCDAQDTRKTASFSLYQGERIRLATLTSRCDSANLTICEPHQIENEDELVYLWAFDTCSIQAKVNPEGEIAIVHDTPTESGSSDIHVSEGNRNYFGVAWNNSLYPRESTESCGGCTIVEGVNCLCETSVEEKPVFTSQPESAMDVILSLHVGAPDPGSFGDNLYSSTPANGFVVHRIGDSYASDTIFEVEDNNGRTLFLKNVQSTVFLVGIDGERTGFSFRNPVHFMSLIPSEATIRDASYETEATLEHYVYHNNTPPFVCVRLIQRFGISNASPRYVESCSAAFRGGTYRSGEMAFGTGKYGDLAATISAIVLDREARSVVLDADPSFGSVREPLLRIIGLMRNLEFEMIDSGGSGESPLAIFNDLDQSIGQMAYEHPSVFSFFLPEFVPEGPVSRASLVAPEAQLLDTHKNIQCLNVCHNLIKYGLSNCYFSDTDFMRLDGVGFYIDPSVGYGHCRDDGLYSKAAGLFTFKPTGKTSEEIIDELATLLTSGRISVSSRRLIASYFDEAVANEDVESGLRVAQQLITTTPEFHTTNIVNFSGEHLPPVSLPANSDKEYKAVIVLMLAGGCDSFNMLVPNECTAGDGGVDAYTHYAEVRNPAHLLQENLLPIDSAGHANCDTFGVHSELHIIQELYKDGDLLFFANAGVLGKPSTKSSYELNTPTQLFAHNTMQYETRAANVFRHAAGAGVLGRLTDALENQGMSTESVSLDASSSMLDGVPGMSSAPYVVSTSGRKFMPQPPSAMSRTDMLQAIHSLNNATTRDSGFMAQTWSSSLVSALHKNGVLDSILTGTNTTTEFGETALELSFEIVSKMIQTRKARGSNVDVFYVEVPGFDTHAGVREKLKERFIEVNAGISSLVKELKAVGLFNNTLLIQASEFGRTLSINSQDGTDHGWGGNYFMLGGSVKGGKILGTYPTDMSDTSDINAGRGRLIPSTAFSQIWTGIAQWLGVTEAEDFDEVCPNRQYFDSVFNAFDLFENVPDVAIPDPVTHGENPTGSSPPGHSGTLAPGTLRPTTNPPPSGSSPSSLASISSSTFLAVSFGSFCSLLQLWIYWI